VIEKALRAGAGARQELQRGGRAKGGRGERRGTVWLEQRYRLEWLSWHFLAHGGCAVKF
jgi:hypothetical protein